MKPKSAIAHRQSALPRGRPAKGYFFRRYQEDQKTKHASIDDPRHATDSIWYCVQVHGFRRAINLHTTNAAIARRRAKWSGGLIKQTDEEKFLQDLSRLGRAAEQRLQTLLGARLENTTSRKSKAR